MATRTEVVKIQAEIEGYRKAMRELDRSTAQAAVAIDRHGNKITGTGARMVRSAEQNREAWTTAGTSLTAFGAVGVAALGLSAKAAIDWESAWTGVLKTVEGTPDQLAALEDGLRDMALRLPATATEIAGVAEAAGQLGVKVEDVEAFTETMINLGETTNLTADEAATAIARISNIMGTAVSDVDRLGSVIVDLGNNSATTEAEIVEFGLRLAAAGKQAGLSEGEILAFGATLSSLGVNAEAGGTAMSKVFYSISDAVLDGGEKLETYAEIAGLTAEEFRKAYGEDAAGAIAMFTAGLGDITEEGGSTTAVLEELELTDQRLRASLSATAAAGGLLTESLALQSEAWEKNTALVEEAEKRYDTTEAKIQIAKNSLNEAAIVIGENLLPMLAGLAEGVADVTQWFAGLPDPIQKAVAGLGGAVSVVALAAGGFLLLFPRIIDTYRAFQTLKVAAPGAATGVGKVTRAAGLATAAIAATTFAVQAFNDATVKTAGAGEATQALLDIAGGADLADTALSGLVTRGGFSDWFNNNDIDSVGEAFDRVANSSFWDKAADGVNTVGSLGSSMSASREQAGELFTALDQGLSSLVQSGELEEAEAALANLAADAGVSVEEMVTLLPQYKDALAGVDTEQRLAVDSTDSLAGSTGELAEETKSYTELLTEQIDLQREAAGAAMNEFDALTQYADAVSTATDALYDENEELIKGARTLDEHSEAGRANRDALSELAGSTWDWVDAGVAAGASTDDLSDRMAEGRDAFIRTAQEMGATKEEAEALADSMGLIPSNISTAVKVTGLDTAIQRLSYLRTQMNGIDGRYVVAGVSTGGGSTFADGGAVSGPGTSTSDSIPAWLSDGEFVQNAAAHRFWGTQAMDAMNDRDVAGFWAAMDARGFAGGGSVARPIYSPNINVRPVVDMSSMQMPPGGDVIVQIDGQAVAHAIRNADRRVS